MAMSTSSNIRAAAQHSGEFHGGHFKGVHNAPSGANAGIVGEERSDGHAN